MRSRRRRLVMAAAALAAGACLSACTGLSSRGSKADSTSQAAYAYPPVPEDPAGSYRCAGHSTGLTQAQSNAIGQQIGATVGQLQMVAPCPGGPVLIGLQPGAEEVAAGLERRYGKNVFVTVGLTIYDGAPGRSPRCGTLPAPTPGPAGLALGVKTELDHDTVTAGQSYDGNVVLTVTKGQLTIDTGQPLEAVVVKPGTRQVVGVFSAGIAGTGYVFTLNRGQSKSVGIIGGTARCDGGIGSALPPGRYQVIVRVAPEGVPHTPVFWAPPVPLRVT